MPQPKKKKGNRRRTAATRPAQPRARRDGDQSAAAGTPPGPGQATIVPAGLRRAETTPLDLNRGAGEYSTLVPAALAGAGATTAAKTEGAAAAVQAPASSRPGDPPAGTADGLPSWAAKAVEELLIVTYWLDPGEHGEPFTATIRFSGRRAGATGKAQPGDTFSQEETVEGIIPGSGPVAITAEIRGVNPGEWTVTARPVARSVRAYPTPGGVPAGDLRVPWPRRVSVPAGPETTVHTAQLLRTKVPGIVRFAYASLVSLGVLAGLGVQALLLAHGHYPVLGPSVFSAIAVVAGVIGAKAWYVAAHRGRKFDGWCVQGFVAGAAVVVAVAALAGPGIPPGAYLGAAAPALLIGMGIGRFGCFWAGCCTGRPTAARRGIWSSDRRVGCRREPAQLLEALAALIIGVVVLGVVLLIGLPRSGPVAVAGLAAYTLARQRILGLRAEPRQWRHGRTVTAAAAVLVLVACAVLLA